MTNNEKKGNVLKNNPLVKAVGSQQIIVLLAVIVLALVFCIASPAFRKYTTFLLIMFIACNLNVNASSGRLRKDSIKTCNGVTYGQHSSDNHWHIASENSDGSYSATGNPIYSDPCNYSDNSSSNNSSNKIPTTAAGRQAIIILTHKINLSFLTSFYLTFLLFSNL